MKVDVYLSNSRSEETETRLLAAELNRRGLAVWRLDDLLPGQNWEASIGTAIQHAKVVIAVFGSSSNPNVVAEAAYAHQTGKLVVVHAGVGRLEIPFAFADIERIPLKDFGRILSAVEERIRSPQMALGSSKISETVVRAKALEARGTIPLDTAQSGVTPDSIFVVHGHDEEMLTTFIAELKRLGVRPIVLRDVDTAHDFLYEKFRVLAGESQHALVLMSGDDLGASLMDFDHPAGGERSLQWRARQNVTLELGFFFGKLGPDKVIVFERKAPASTKFLPRMERPSDLDGRMFLKFDEAGAWRALLRSRLEDHGFELRDT
jgi:predicted nucleotide-binding protein